MPIEGLTVSGLILVVSVAAWILSTSYMNKKDAIKDEAAKGPTLFEAFICQAIIFLLFELLLDMGPMRVERAARYSYLGYLAGAAIIFFRRRKAMTRSDYLFLKWAWIPIWVLGIPCVFYLFFSRDAFW